MISREFEYTVSLSSGEQSTYARLCWDCSNKYGEYLHHTLLIDHIESGAFNVASREALAVMQKDYPNTTFRVRDVFASCDDNNFYLQFVVDAIED